MKIQGTGVRFLVCLALSAIAALAQVDTATITGLVTDPTGAAIVGAEIEVVNKANGVRHTVSSNESGAYVAPALTIGVYDLEAKSEGFQTTLRRNITLNAGARARIDLQLTLGQVSEVVEVTGQVPLLESETSSLGQVIENTTITQMPLNGRNYQELALLSAGVLPSRTQNFVEDAFSANGASFDQNVFTLDGGDNNNYFSGIVVASNQAVKPSIDAVQEFKLDTHTYGAEFGRGGGAVMQITTKSGTNEIHGTVFEFLRNDKLDANNFFNSGRDKPPYRQNQFGGTIGGPIVKDRMFYFFSYEGLRIREKLTGRTTVPLPAQIGGNFAGVRNIYDPATQRPDGMRDQFANNVIPSTRFDPVALRMAQLYPAPNVSGTAINNFIFNPSRNRDDDKIDWKYDFRVTNNHSIFLRHSYLNYDRLEPGALPLPASGGNTAIRLSRGQTAIFNWTAVLPGGGMVNEMRLGYNRLVGGIDTPTSEQLWRDFGFKGLFDRDDINGLPLFQVTGYQNVGDRSFAPDPRKQDVRQFIDTLSWTAGKHSVKMGVNFRNFVRWSGITNFARGQFGFNQQFTRQFGAGGPGGDAIADMLLGLTNTARLSNAIDARRHAWSYETYIQDTWKATQKLTLNLGLRYEQQTPYSEQNRRASNFVLDSSESDFGQLRFAQEGSYFSEAFLKRNKTDFGPRVGLAYRLTEKTVIRAGYGVFYLGTFVLNATSDPTANAPFFLDNIVPTQTAAATSNVIVRNGFPGDFLDPNAPLTGKSLYGTWPFEDYEFQNGMTNQWNINIQHTLPGNALFSVAYVGSNTAHAHERPDLNQPRPGAGGNNPRRWFPNFAGLNTTVAIGNTNYQGLEMKLERRFTDGFSVLSGFTYSKTTQGNLQQRTAIEYLAMEKSLSNQHMPQRFFFSSVYDLPFGKGRKHATQGALSHIIGGWQISPIFSAQRGLYVTPGVVGNPANTTGGQRPNRVGDHRIARDQRSPDLWFDPSAFEIAPNLTFGNSASFVIEGPGQVNLDLMVNRTFRVNERFSVDFRTEFFNALNEAHFNFPNTAIGNTAVATISQTADSMRQIQFGLKLIF